MENEIWKDVVGYEGLYQVSNLGRVRSLDRYIELSNQYKLHKRFVKGKLLNPSLNTYGYPHVGLIKDKKQKTVVVHRLVAEAFLDNPLNKKEVNHIDENKENAKLSNLEWATRIENNNHGTRNQRVSKPVIQLDENNKIIKIHNSIVSASMAVGAKEPSSIGMVCSGKRKKAYGYKWIYESEL